MFIIFIIYLLCLYIYTYVYVYMCIYIYILKRQYKEIEKSIFDKRMMVIYIYISEFRLLVLDLLKYSSHLLPLLLVGLNE